jgi:hypothetical protein
VDVRAAADAAAGAWLLRRDVDEEVEFSVGCAEEAAEALAAAYDAWPTDRRARSTATRRDRHSPVRGA